MWWLVAILSFGLVHCQSNYEKQAPSTNYVIEDEGVLPSIGNVSNKTSIVTIFDHNRFENKYQLQI